MNLKSLRESATGCRKYLNKITEEDLIDEEGLTKIRRTGILKIRDFIESTESFWYEPELASTPAYTQKGEYIIMKANYGGNGEKIKERVTFSSANPHNTGKDFHYYAELCEYRLLSRAVLDFTGLNKFGVLGEDEKPASEQPTATSLSEVFKSKGDKALEEAKEAIGKAS